MMSIPRILSWGQIAYAYTLNFNYVNRLSFKNCCAQGYGWGWLVDS